MVWDPGSKTVLRTPLGLMLHTGDLPYPEIVRYAQTAEASGYDQLLLTEESGKEAFSLLALLAQGTERIALGTGIVSFYTRTPTLLAMAARSLFELSGGRFGPLGLGTGGIGFMSRGHGVPLDRPVGRARETVEIVRSLLTESRTTYPGRWFKVEDFHLREGPLPAGSPLPIWLAALGPQMAKMSGKVADGLITNWLIPESLAEFRSLVREGSESAGRDPAAVTIASLTMVCADPGDEEAVMAARRGVAFYCASLHYHHIAELAGLGEEARRVYAAWESRDFDGAAHLVTDHLLERFTLSGSDADSSARLRWMLDEGVVPIIYPLPRRSRMVEDHFRVLRRAAAWAGRG